MTTFLDLIRKVYRERKRSFIQKGGKGSGWYAPPKGTHGKGEGMGNPVFSPGPERDRRRKARHYDVISETDEESAKVLLTQGIEPSFKPQISPVEIGSPGQGLERDSLYTANEEAFSRGSFGKVRLLLSVDKDQLAVPEEGKRLRHVGIDKPLESNLGATTKGVIPKEKIVGVEVREGGKWIRKTPLEYLRSVGIDPDTPKLPSVPKYKKWLEENAEKLSLSPNQVEDTVFDYNRASLEDKIWMAKEAGFI